MSKSHAPKQPPEDVSPPRSEPSRVTSPAAWDAATLASADEWRQRLTAAEVHDLREAAAETEGQPLESIESRSLGAFDARIAALQQSLEHGRGAVLLQGLDLEGDSDAFAKQLFWLVAQRLGTPVSQSAQGERLFAVQDAGFGDADRRARGPNTRKRLSFHTDRCDVIGFLCVRQAQQGGENDVISSVTLFNRILAARPDLCRTLMEPYLYQRHNVDEGNQLAYCAQPIFSIFRGHFAANCLRVLIERAYASPDVPDMTPIQREALDYLEQTAEDETLYHRFRLAPGDLLFLNNWVTFHRRTEFVDHAEPTKKRLLLRAWLSMPNNRPIDPRFADHYGNTEGGAVRGGMRPRA